MSPMVTRLCVVSVLFVLAGPAVSRDKALVIGPIVPLTYPIENPGLGGALTFLYELEASQHLSVCPAVSYSYIPFADYTSTEEYPRRYEDVRITNYWAGLDIRYYARPVEARLRLFAMSGLALNNMSIDSKGYGGIVWGSSGRILDERSLMISIGAGLVVRHYWLIMVRLEHTFAENHFTQLPIQLGIVF